MGSIPLLFSTVERLCHLLKIVLFKKYIYYSIKFYLLLRESVKRALERSERIVLRHNSQIRWKGYKEEFYLLY